MKGAELTEADIAIHRINNILYRKYEAGWKYRFESRPSCALYYILSGEARITLPEGVISIKAYAFYKCRSLRSVSLPSTLLSIEDYAFAHCESLEAIPLPSSLLTIGEYAFFNCDALKRIVIPASVERIDFKAFRKCDGIDIYAEAEKRPDGWHRKFKPIFERVEWGYTGS